MSRKIAKLTWLNNGNYGSVLQALALQKYLVNNGYDVTDLDYNASLKTKLLNWLVNKNSPKLFLGKYKEAKRKRGYKDPKKFDVRSKRFAEFKKKNMKISGVCKNPAEIKKEAEKYDVFICGSDQIWSPALMNPVFYFSFLEEGKSKIAYAPSFGVMDTTQEKKNKISKYLKGFDYISVREPQGKDIVKEITGKDVPVVIDPTLLIGKNDWGKYTGERIIKDNYIFCYLLTPNPIYIKAVKKFAESKKLKVVIVPTSKGPFDTEFKEMVDAGPQEWLNLIQNAECVCTDSFHGCIFSSIFNREFILFKRFQDTDKKSENSRVYNLVKLLQEEDRLIDEKNIDSIYELKEINFDKIKQIIMIEAEKSGKWLLNALDNVMERK